MNLPELFANGWVALDSTECKVHRIEIDGTIRFFAFYPKKWDVLEPTRLTRAKDGTEVEVCMKSITEWDSVELEVKS